MSGIVYSQEFYLHQAEGSKPAAQHVNSLLTYLFALRSVVDLGCGLGDWLSALQDASAEKVRWFDSDYVVRSRWTLLFHPRASNELVGHNPISIRRAASNPGYAVLRYRGAAKKC